MKKEIKNLDVFHEKGTFIRLYDRADHIENLIRQAQTIKGLDNDLKSTLEAHGIDVTNIIRTYAESMYLLYRSMFQGSIWEKEYLYISTTAYAYDAAQNRIHDEIVKYCNEVLAHQDIQGAPFRGLDSPIVVQNGNEIYLMWNSIKYLDMDLQRLIDSMKISIKNNYLSKFGMELNTIRPYESAK